MRELEEVLHSKTVEYKHKSYVELRRIVDNVELFETIHKNRSYNFEIHAIFGNENEIKVMVECSRNILLLNFIGKAEYFAITPDGKVRDIEGEEF